MYPYILVINCKGQIARALRNDPIPKGWFKVIRIKHTNLKGQWTVYEEDGELKLQYWSIIRWHEADRYYRNVPE